MLSVSVVLLTLAAVLFLALVWDRRPKTFSDSCIVVCLAVGWSVGIASCLYFVWLVLYGETSPFYALAEIGFSVAVLVYAFVKRPSGSTLPADTGSDPGRQGLIRRIIQFTLLAAILACVGFAISLYWTHPSGGWDAWAIWNLRARFFFRGHDHWADGFTNILLQSHPDYPLLLPATVARLWTLVGSESTVVPGVVAFLFVGITAGLLAFSLAVLRSKTQGCLAALTLLATSGFFEQGSTQMADVPLSYYYLATLILLSSHDRGLIRGSLALFVAGMMTGFAAWTKNEGMVFVGVIFAARFLLRVKASGWRGWWSEARIFSPGLIPVAVPLVYFKLRLAPPNDLAERFSLSAAVAKATQLSRYLEIAHAFLSQLLEIGSGLILGLVAYGLLLGTTRAGRGVVLAFPVVVVGLMVFADFAIYLLTPQDLRWHLDSSLSRLLMQLWPSFLFAFFLAVRTPEEALARVRSRVEPQSPRNSVSEPEPSARVNDLPR